MATAQHPRETAEKGLWPISNATLAYEELTIDGYIVKVHESFGDLAGLPNAINRTKQWSLGDEKSTAREFAEQLCLETGKEQVLHEEIGAGIDMVHARLRQLADPSVKAVNSRFKTGVRGPDLGKGGMGLVFKAALRGRTRAVKGLLSDSNPELVERFIREQNALQLLDGEIAPQFDGVEIIDGKRYIIMDWVDGRNLEQILAIHGGRMSPQHVYSVLAPYAAAVGNLVDKFGIYHRDTKPLNAMVDKKGELKIIDFGLADDEDGRLHNKDNRAHETRSGSVMGSPGFMSKQQYLDFSVLDPRNESFALGASAYYLLTGQTAAPQGASAHYDWNGEVDLSLVPDEARDWIAGLTHKDINKRTPLSEAGRFAFENADDLNKTMTWEQYYDLPNVKRALDPKKLLVMDGNGGLVRSAPPTYGLQKTPGGIVTMRNGLIAAGAAVTLFIIIGGVAYEINKRMSGAKTDETTDNNGKKKRSPTILFSADDKGKRQITFQGKRGKNGEVQKLAEIPTTKGAHFRQKNGSILGSRQIVDDAIMADILGVDPSNLPKEWSGQQRWSWDIHNNNRSGLFVSGIGFFVRRPDGTVIAFATDRGKGLPIVQGLGVGNIFSYGDRLTDPDFVSLFDDIVTSDLTDDGVEVGDIGNFPPPPHAKGTPVPQWTKAGLRANYAEVVGDEQTFISRAQKKNQEKRESRLRNPHFPGGDERLGMADRRGISPEKARQYMDRQKA